MKTLLLKMTAGILLLSGMTAASGTVGVDWGGNYGALSNYTGNLNQGLALTTTSTGDYTFDSISDAAYRLPFGTVYSPSIDSRVNAPAGKTGKLYTGLQTVIHSSGTPLTVAGIYRFSAGVTPNQLQRTNPTNTVASTMSLSVAYFVKKADFLNGLSSAPGLSFSNAAGSASMDVLVKNTNAATIGFMVQNGTNWYATVAKTAVENSYSVLSINPSAENWYAFDPSGNQYLNTNSLGTATAGSAFTDIQAFGIYGQHMSVNGQTGNAEKFDVQGFSGGFDVVEIGTAGVDWGGNYGAASNFAGVINQALTLATTSTGDYTFDSISDAAYRLPFGTVYSPSVDGSRYVPPAGKTGKLYTGLQTVIHSSSTPLTNSVGLYRFSATMATNQLQRTNPTNEVPGTMSLSVTYFVKKADFINGLDSAGSLGFSDWTGAASMDVLVRNINPVTIGFLVQNGTNWYATIGKPTGADSTFGVLPINPYTANWYAFDPDANQFLNTNSPGTATAGSAFTDIQAFGIYGQHMSVNAMNNNAEKFDVQGFSGTLESLTGGTYTLTGSAGANGSVSPETTNVPSGGNADFVITASNYYRIASLATNGTSVGWSFDNTSTSTNFTWSNVQSTGAVVATFTAQVASDPAATPYWWLAQYGLTNFDTDAVTDTDSDGHQSWQEYLAGTDPTNAASVLKVLRVTTDGTDDTVKWLSSSGVTGYNLAYKTNLMNNTWTASSNNIAPTAPTNTITITRPGQTVFYKVTVTN